MKRSRRVSAFIDRLRSRNARSRDRRRFYRERIDLLRRTPSNKDAFFDYLFLLSELQDSELIVELRSTFRREWAPTMQRELARHLRAADWAVARGRIDAMRWEWEEGVGEGAPAAVTALIEHLAHPQGPSTSQTVDEVVSGFQAVGLAATGPVVQWLAASASGQERIAETLFSRAGASGRYLVQRWGERDAAVQAWLSQREVWAGPALARAGEPCALWPAERSESPVAQQGAARLALDFNPFGPDKAEQDPLLPDLFYRMWPVWQEVTTPRPSLLVVPAGCGRSALMWMMRYESELVGSALDRTLAAYAPLHAPLDTPALARHLARAVYVAATCFLARCPEALLGLDDARQRGLGSFLLRMSGGLAPLLADLERAGLCAGEPDGRLLQEALDRAVGEKEPRSAGLDGAGSMDAPAAGRALLRDAFTDRELVAFCQDRPAFRPVLADFGPRFSFADMIDALVSYALRRNLWETLLAEVEAFNPGQFDRHRPGLAGGHALVGTPGEGDPLRFSRPYGIDYVFLLVDISFQDEAAVTLLLDRLFERWLPSLAPQHIVPKVFVSRCPPARPVTPVHVEWSADTLLELLSHRLERAGLVGDSRPLSLDGWVDGVDDVGRALVEAAEDVPERLVRIGNRLMERLAQPDPLGRDEFLGLLARQ